MPPQVAFGHSGYHNNKKEMKITHENTVLKIQQITGSIVE